MSTTASVSNLTQQCLDKLHKATTGKGDIEYQNHLESRLAGFKLWVDNVGAVAKSGASLDSRFRSRPDDLDLVRNILSLLSHFLDEYMSTLHGGLPIAEALVNIDSAIKNLAKIGVAIRRTGNASRSRRANQSFNPNEHREFKRYLECLVLLRPSQDQPQPDGLGISSIHELIDSIPADSNEQNDILGTRLEQLAQSRMDELDSTKLNEIQKRLIDANLRRRHNFLLAQKRSQRIQKMTQNRMAAEKQQPDVVAVASSEIAPTTHGSAQTKILASQEPKNRPTKSKAPPTATGYTIASTAEGTLYFNPTKKQQRTPTLARSQISFIAANAEFPKPPLSSQDQLMLKCPCCCQSLPSEDFTNPNRWRQHLIEDLCPYTCIAQSCPTPDMLFTTRKAWELHVENDHPSQWQCLLCDEDDEPYSSEEDLTTHTHSQHKEELMKYEISFLLSSAEVRYMGIESCPLCSSYGPRDSPELVDHAVRHAYEFALRALPWPQSKIEDLNKPIGTYSLQNTPDTEQFEKWLDSVPCSTEEPTIDVSSFDEMDHALQENEDGTPAEDYFANNDYFEDDESADGSKRQTAQARSSIVWTESSGRDPEDATTQIAVSLTAAATRGDEDAVSSLIEDCEAFDSDGEIRKRALIAAIKGGHVAIVERLFESGIDINSQDEKGWTALFFAIEKNDILMARHLIESGIDVNVRNHDGLTALHIAIQTDNSDDIRALFALNMYQIFTVDRVQEAISWAEEQGHHSAVEVLRDLREKYEPMISRAQEAFNIEDRTAAARSITQGNGWYALIDPLLEPVHFDLVDTLEYNDSVFSVTFSRDGKYVAAGGKGGIAQVFEIETRQNVCALEISTNDDWVYGVCFSPDGRSLFTACGTLIQAWDIATKTVQHSFHHEETACSLDVSTDGRLIVSGDNRGNVYIWDLEQGVEVKKFSTDAGEIYSVKISPDGGFVAAGCQKSLACAWNLKTDSSEAITFLHADAIWSIALSSDGSCLLTGGGHHSKLWELATGTRISEIAHSERTVDSVSMTPDDRWIVTAFRNGSIRFWDPAAEKSHYIINAHSTYINSLAFRPQGGYFATVSSDHTLRIWSYGQRRRKP